MKSVKHGVLSLELVLPSVAQAILDDLSKLALLSNVVSATQARVGMSMQFACSCARRINMYSVLCIFIIRFTDAHVGRFGNDNPICSLA